jgi:hypothetical protein
MNLGKLLGLGKSFFGGNREASYQVNRRACLPKFNEGRNPFAAKTAAGTATVAAAEAVKAAPPSPPLVIPPPAPIKTILPNMQNKVLVVGRPEKAAAVPQGKAAAPGAAKPGRLGWTTRLNPFRAPAQETSAPGAVQAEFSLNAVKVIHNDLADADVEVVPVKSRAPATAAAPVLPPARQAWEYMGENMLNSA